MSEWKTRITKVQVVKPARGERRGLPRAHLPAGPGHGPRFPLARNEIVARAAAPTATSRSTATRCRAATPGSTATASSGTVEDLGSTNGSLRQRRAGERSPSLRDADFLKIGAAIFKFLSGTGIETRYHEEIYRMTIVDGLTGAHNKRYFLEFLEREIARCARYRRPLSLLMFDIDHFKLINDTHGHLTGDYVLKELSRRLLGRDPPRGAARALRRRGVRGGPARDRPRRARCTFAEQLRRAGRR